MRVWTADGAAPSSLLTRRAPISIAAAQPGTLCTCMREILLNIIILVLFRYPPLNNTYVHHKVVEVMAAMSLTEERCRHIVQYLRGSRCSGKTLYPDGFSSNQKRALRRQASWLLRGEEWCPISPFTG